MKTETITITNASGTEIMLSFDRANIIQDARGIGLRIPTTFGKFSRAVSIEAHKTTYPSTEAFLSRVEQFGKPYVAKWLQASSDNFIGMSPPDMTHGWVIGLE